MTDFLNIFFPTVRRSVPGVGNPAYVDDIRAGNQLLIDGLSAILGLYNSGGFAIVSGLDYDENAHIFSPGIFWLDGNFYYQQQAFAEGLFLVGIEQPTMAKPFSDTNARPIYINFVATSTSDPTGATPVFFRNMNNYRLGLTYNKEVIQNLISITTGLKQAAYLDVGTVVNTVAAGNDPRLVGDSNYFETRYARKADVILKNQPESPGAYTPVNPWDPVNKAYSDATSGRRLAAGTVNLADADAIGGTMHVIDTGVVVPNAKYVIMFTNGSLSANHNLDIFYNICWAIKQNSSFGVWYKEAQAGVQNVQLDWVIFGID